MTSLLELDVGRLLSLCEDGNGTGEKRGHGCEGEGRRDGRGKRRRERDGCEEKERERGWV